jgi:chromosome partitioning protein
MTYPGSHIVVVGNEKGGSGKSTTAMHLVVALLRIGHKVAVVDLDARQRTLARYVENRIQFAERKDVPLPMPTVEVVAPAALDTVTDAQADELERLESTLQSLAQDHPYIVIDSPGSDTHLSRQAHARADTLITPLNDSFVDFDLLGQIDPDTYEVRRPSLYAELVWESRKRRMLTERSSMDWVVLRNRMSSLDARNKRRVADALEALAPRIGFRLALGFGERVIYRELFPLGLTLLDLADERCGVPLTMSHVAARQEVRDLVRTLKLPGVDEAEAA